VKIPQSASEINEVRSISEQAIFINPYFGKEKLTRQEALDVINILSGELVVDGRNRGSQEEHPERIFG
jgi:hypothetical protein